MAVLELCLFRYVQVYTEWYVNMDIPIPCPTPRATGSILFHVGLQSKIP